MVITGFSKIMAKNFTEDLKKDLESFADKYGLTYNYQSGKFTDTNLYLKIEFSVKDLQGQAQLKEVVIFKTRGWEFGFKPEDLNLTIQLPNLKDPSRNFRICGLNPKRYKFPVIVESTITGKRYCYPTEPIMKALGRV